MTVAPGTPTFTPPAYSVPVLSAGSVAVGAVIAPVKLESTSSTAQTNVPFRFGQVFKIGALAPGAFIVGKIAGQADIPLQFNVLATFPDGSVRFAAISGVLPGLAAGATISMDLVRSSTGASTAPIPAASFVNAGFAASVALAFSGVAYSADAATAIAAAAQAAARTPGAIATEYNVVVAPKTAGGQVHPDLEIRFDVVYFPGAGAFKVDITLEHARAFSDVGDLAYSGTAQAGGKQVIDFSGGITQFPHTRWKRTAWINNDHPVVVRQDRDYLIDSRAVANYDRRVTVAESVLANYQARLATVDFEPLHSGMFTPYMGTTGGRPDIGLLPGYAAATVLTMDKRAIAMTKACGEVGGSWGVHFRDASSGPGKGYPISVINWPYCTEIWGAADVNPATGAKEFMNYPASMTWLTPEESHTPNMAYLPYLLTADLFYLEELQFWSTWVIAKQNYSYRQQEKGIIQRNQTRGQAWCMRSIGECAAFTPDTHPLKSHFNYWLDSNLANYAARYVTGQPNGLGCLNDATNDVDTPYGFIEARNGIALYQDDFFTSAIGHIVDLGYTAAKPLLLWKAKFQIGRLLAPGICYTDSCFFALRIRDTQYAQEYATLRDCYVGSIGYGEDGIGAYTQAILDAPCNSQQRLDLLNGIRQANEPPFVRNQILGYSFGTEGYVANFQPGLAMAVDSGYTDGDLAWDLFDNRTVKPPYENSPQFAIVPRFLNQIEVPPTVTTSPSDIYQVASGLPIYGGRAAPVAPAAFDSVTFRLTGNGDPEPINYNRGAFLVLELHGSSGENDWTGTQYRAAVSGPLAYMSDTTFGFSTVVTYDPKQVLLRPIDNYNQTTAGLHESMWMGFRGMPESNLVHLITVRRVNALLEWAKTNLSAYDQKRMAVTGGSMGGWGSLTYGMRRPDVIAAIYADRPRWRSTAVADWGQQINGIDPAHPPSIAPEDGGGLVTDYMDMVAYAANPANKLPWISWCLGRKDGFAGIPDMIDGIAALRATKRGFACYWNDGDHATGSQVGQITQSYPFGLFELGKGYPLFTEHSLDNDPRVDLVGGINLGLSFRNVVETATGWSCEITNVLGACTVNVEPTNSAVFKASVAKKSVTIPAANTWVPVSFTA